MTYDQYLELVVKIARQNLKAGSSCITAAAVGQLLRLAVPDITWKSFSKGAMRDVLLELEAAGRIRLTRTAKGALAIEPIGDLGTSQNEVLVTHQMFNPLHKAVWSAFVLNLPPGRRFLHRVSGLVRVGLDEHPSPIDEWVEINPIDIDTQKGWAIELMDGELEPNKAVLREAISSTAWRPADFLKELHNIDKNLARRWNQIRSVRVSTIVQNWLASHSLSNSVAFNVDQKNSQLTDSFGAIGDSGREATRRAILELLGTLTLEQLLDLRIPVSSCLAAVKQRH